MLEIIFQDEHLVAINKPHGLLVHKSTIAADVSEFAVQILREQIGCKVFPAHRLDRKTSGVLLFALSPAMNSMLQVKFQNREIQKNYLAVVRGFLPENGEINYPLTNDRGQKQEALTRFERLAIAELPIPLGKHATSRYSLVKLIPETGRQHQLRKHLAHIFHPIIGDRPHGCNKQNKLWLEKWEMNTMLLHASELKFEHPITGENIEIKAGFQPVVLRALHILNLENIEF
ncbi:MAG: pseudouridylate synthase [Bacteroidetes bacterium]|nr:pseudouridylate synthase [Bacteroidota bacterium]